MLKQYQEPVIQALELDPSRNPNNVKLFIKREDLIHPTVSGNKWRKLKYNLALAQQSGFERLITFGGAYSNHIYAVAAAAGELGFKSVGIIRGEESLPLNPTLQFATEQGMQLSYISRAEYRTKDTEDFKQHLLQKFGKSFLIPEGGTNSMAIMGAAEIMSGVDESFDEIVVATGTGGTMAGIISGLNGRGFVTGIPVLKGDFMENEVGEHLKPMGLDQLTNYTCRTEYHFGGYAKFDNSLIQFINRFRSKYGIPLDPIYTGKMMFATFDLIEKGHFKSGVKVLAIHTGGLQGIAGFNQRFGDLIEQ